MTRRPIIAANWKMHHDHLVAIQVVQKLSYRLEPADYEHVDVVVCPPFTDLRTLQTLTEADKLPIQLGAQNCHWQDQGAFTGEVSPPMLARLTVRYVIVGHSERRQHFGETNESVRRRLHAALAGGLTPIVCVGETLEEREADATDAVIARQVETALTGLRLEQLAGCIVAYEPVWAIGTGRTATPGQAQEVHHAIRRQLVGIGSATTAERVRIIYGGSVKPDNIDALMAEPDIDGALVGGASLDAASFARIVQFR